MAPKRTKVVAPVAPSIPKRTKGTVLIANHHTGGFTFTQRSPDGKILLKPLRLPPGTTTPVPAEDWLKCKEIEVVKHYMDKGLIAEVTQDRAEVPVRDATSTKLTPPDHLKTDQELSNEAGGTVAAKVTRQNPGSVNLK
jgi:hypothetical protein